mgnify:CR=1|tara:strand:+ start:362 stop:955 length:594 start_codon:yes stop_codon:yes gene_type:complete
MNNFDGIAWCYDFVKRLVFGDVLDQASAHFLSKIPPGSKVLIIGGGTGRILNDISGELQITYLEKSANMLRRAQKRQSTSVDFEHIDFLDFQAPQKFDCIICPFFLDLFTQEMLGNVMLKLKESMVPGGQLLVADFSHRSSVLLKVMYLGFRALSNIPAKSIPPIQEMITFSGFHLIDSTMFLNGQVFSSHFRHVSN